MVNIDPKYGQLDADTLLFLQHFVASPGATVLEIGANEEPSADILTDNGYKVTAVDLRPAEICTQHKRIVGDFLTTEFDEKFDCCFSTSAIEHFGLDVYGSKVDSTYDKQAATKMYHLLKPGGRCWITVPYGRDYEVARDWRVYNQRTLHTRIIQAFVVEKKIFFKSADALCPDMGGEIPIVAEKDADQYANGETHPHVTVLLQMVKPA